MTLPPSTAIIAFAVLFGHPVLQMALIGFGARSFAVTPWGRIATYASATVAGGLVALALQHAPLPPPAQPRPEGRTAPEIPAPESMPRTIGETGIGAQSNLMRQGIFKGSSVFAIPTNKAPSVGEVGASIVLDGQDLKALTALLDAVHELKPDGQKFATNYEGVARSISEDSDTLNELRRKASAALQLAGLGKNLRISLRVGSPGTNFTTTLDERSGRPIFPEPARDGEDR